MYVITLLDGLIKSERACTENRPIAGRYQNHRVMCYDNNRFWYRNIRAILIEGMVEMHIFVGFSAEFSHKSKNVIRALEAPLDAPRHKQKAAPLRKGCGDMAYIN